MCVCMCGWEGSVNTADKLLVQKLWAWSVYLQALCTTGA